MIHGFTAAIKVDGEYYDCEVTPIARLRDYCSVKEAAEKSGYSRQAIEKMLKAGKLYHIKDISGHQIVYCPPDFKKGSGKDA